MEAADGRAAGARHALGELDSSLPPAVWTVVARAGALLALALAFRLARRLAGGGPAGILAGAIAAVALALTPDWFQFAAHASEAPLAVALMLWAIERHLDGRRDHALGLGALACLLRPELFPFLCAYALWLWRAEPTRRSLIAGLMLVVPLAWTVPEWIGSGNPLGGGEQARSEPRWSLSHAEQPWRRALVRVDNHTGTAVELLALAAVVFAIARRQAAVVVLAAAAVVEAALYLLMTEADFSGNPRYVLPALVILCVLAGVGAARLTAAASAFGPRPLRVAGALAAAGALAVLATPHLERSADRLAFEAREVSERMSMHRDLDAAVAAVGGAEAVIVHGPAAANRALRTHLAWTLGATISEIEGARGQGLVFRTENRFLAASHGHLHAICREFTFRQDGGRIGVLRVVGR